MNIQSYMHDIKIPSDSTFFNVRTEIKLILFLIVLNPGKEVRMRDPRQPTLANLTSNRENQVEEEASSFKMSGFLSEYAYGKIDIRVMKLNRHP